MNENQELFDVIVVGSGIGGSGCASLLSNKGYKVLLLEKNNRVGGACSSYKKNGFTIDVAVHMFSQTNRRTCPFGKIIRRSGGDPEKELPFWTGLAYKTVMKTRDDRIIKMPNLEEAQDKNPAEQFQIMSNYLAELGATPEEAKILSDIYIDMFTCSRKKMYELMDVSLKDYVNQFTDSAIVHGFLSYMAGIFFVIPESLVSAGEYIWNIRDPTGYGDGGGYPIGGAIAIPSAFVRVFKRNNGILKLNSRVQKIITDDGKVSGVELQNGMTYHAPIVVSNAGIKKTISDLISDKSTLNKVYINLIENLVPSYSSVTFKVALKKKVIKDIAAMHLFYVKIDEFNQTSLNKMWNKIDNGIVPYYSAFMTPIPSNMDPKCAPKGKQLLILGGMAPAKLKPGSSKWKDWIDTYWDYILELLPEIERYIEFVDTTTPGDIIKFTGKDEAPVEGTAMACLPGQAGKDRVSSRIPNIKGLYVSGDTAGADVHGIGTQLAANSAINCFKLIRKDFPKSLLI
ncbi:MAG: NAD(P)-binding protein [Candidatus Lokiarchaeota archaeon]|nr:NAD(P)-binding protein [Candidatus Lokiarchaeota archaeon]